MSDSLLGVIDVGKTSTRLFLVAPASADIVWSARRPSEMIAGPALNQLDLAGAEQWLLGELSRAPGKERITHLVPVGHGAAAALLDGADRILLAPDYEDARFGRTRLAYARERDEFSSTFSPHLPDGLNLGAQLHFVEARLPARWRRVSHILPLPQYFAWRLSGVMASEVTSLGAHTDLWLPRQRRFSSMARRRGWDRLFPQLRRADEALGCITPAVAQLTGLEPSCKVLCGIHDSNASFLGQRVRWPHDAPLAVVSSGTWTIVMARGVDLGRLDQSRDMLANVDPFGAPLGTARFMGGREYAAIAGEQDRGCETDAHTVGEIVERGWLALPSFTHAGGPFQGRTGRILGPAQMSGRERTALASLYLALMVDVMLDLLGHAGGIVIDGPLALDRVFAPLLAALRPGGPVLLSATTEGSVRGACVLAAGMGRVAAGAETGAETGNVVPLGIHGLAGYKAKWRSECAVSEGREQTGRHSRHWQ